MVFSMFRFQAKQKIFETGETKVGGQIGELPTVLIGNIFYKGMPEITDHKKGEFDRKAVLKWISLADKLAEKTGVPHLLDVMAMHPEAMKKYITFVCEQTDTVFFIDGATSETCMAGLEAVKELGLEKKTVFNAISPQTSKGEIEAIRESGVTAAVLLAQNEMDYSPKGRVTMLKGFNEHKGLLKTAREAGVDKILIDTIVFDVPSIAYAAEAIKLVKDELGYPSGCSPANATYDWKQSQDKAMRKSFAAYNASAHTIAQLSGANFLIYGPLKQARNVIPACAMSDAIIAYYASRQMGTKPLVNNHPLYKIF
jgi:tetrahydromethanopterin S-methyltransferase subunit H